MPAILQKGSNNNNNSPDLKRAENIQSEKNSSLKTEKFKEFLAKKSEAKAEETLKSDSNLKQTDKTASLTSKSNNYLPNLIHSKNIR